MTRERQATTFAATAMPPIPPVNLEAEQAVLGACLHEPSLVDVAVERFGLLPEHFHLDRHRRVFQAMLRLVARGEGVDIVTVKAELGQTGLDEIGGDPALANLQEAGTVGTLFPEYVAIVLDHAERRALLRLCGTTMRALTADNDHARPTREIRAGLVRELTELDVAPPGGGTRLGTGLGTFVAQDLGATDVVIETLLAAGASGWIGGEEKLGKTLYALHEATCLALGEPVLGRFAVLRRRRVLLLEEEDGPRRTHRRLRALLRGMGIDPTDHDVQADLDDWFRLVVRESVSLDEPARLLAEVRAFQPEVIYLDALWRLTARDLNKAAEAAAVVATLDRLGRETGAVIRVVHHFRKSQGFRTGRGSQEIAGSFVLGAWGEVGVFFEPLGRKAGAVRVDVQSKDAPPIPPFKLIIESEGPPHDPTWLRLRAEDLTDATAGTKNREAVLEALRGLAPIPADDTGALGLPVDALAEKLGFSKRTVRDHLAHLRDNGVARIVGTATRQGKRGQTKADLWGLGSPA